MVATANIEFTLNSEYVPKIIGFLQVRNEIESGHLERFIEINVPLFDHFVVYDDASDDGTAERIEPYCDVLVREITPHFGDELRSRQHLLESSKHLANEQDFYLWLDTDEVLFASKEELISICQTLNTESFDGARLPHINLWRSNNFFRTDDYFDDLYPLRLWRAGAKLAFPLKSGLHNEMHPEGMRSVARLTKPAVVHFGFASDKLLEDKFSLYHSYGQRGRNLYRLISEKGRVLVPLNSRSEILGARYDSLNSNFEPEPEIREQTSWMVGASKAIERRRHEAKPIVTLISLIYCSVEWLEFEYAELLKLSKHFSEDSIEILFVANNATPEVLTFLQENLIPHIVANTQQSTDEWFQNYIYRGYNEGVKAAKAEYVFLTNSDMAYAPGCLQSLLRDASPKRFLTSRLIELGRFQSGQHAIEKYFGSTPSRFQRRHFESFALKISNSQQSDGGLFMPLLLSKETFLSLGGFPEGNLSLESLETYVASGVVGSYALRGESCIPGDAAFFQRAKSFGITHQTLFDSIGYHFQAGERTDESKKSRIRPSGIAIVNDHIDGINGESVLWRQLQLRLTNWGVRVITVGGVDNKVRFNFWVYAMRALHKLDPKPRIVFANATFFYPVFGPWRNIVLRQDVPAGARLTDKWLRFWQQANSRLSKHLISNDSSFAAGFTYGIAEWLTIPLSPLWTEAPPPFTKDSSKTVGLFVGAFNPAKGWDEIRAFIEKHPEIQWNLVSKYSDDPHGLPNSTGPNWTVHRNLEQTEIRDLMRTATFLLVNSPHETQCLVALEAASQNLPILSTPTGTLGSLSVEQRRKFGEISAHPLSKIQILIDRIGTDPKLDPRGGIIHLDLIGEQAYTKWDKMFEEQIRLSFSDTTGPGLLLSFLDRLRGAIILKIRQMYRERLVPPLIRLLKPLRRP
jgi:hypothetical protein